MLPRRYRYELLGHTAHQVGQIEKRQVQARWFYTIELWVCSNAQGVTNSNLKRFDLRRSF